MSTGTAVATGDIITAAKMNLKLESVDDSDVTKTDARTYGVDGTGQDCTWYTDTESVYMKLDVSEETLLFTDSFYVKFGTGSDLAMYWDGSNFYLMPATDDTGAIIVGDGTNKSMDFKWFGPAVGQYISFDLGDAKAIWEGVDLQLMDTDFLIFGDGSDVLIDWTGSLLLIVPAIDDTGAINIGNGTVDMDVKIFLGTTGKYAEFNVGDSCLNLANDAVAADGRILKVSITSATPAMSDGYGAVEIDATISGTATGWFSPLSSWINITGSGVAGAGGFMCAQQNGVYADSGANTGSTIIFGMRAQAVLTDAPTILAPFSINTSNREITALFEMNANPDVGYQANAGETGGKVGDVPLFCDAAGQQYFVRIYSARG